ncbi:MAG: Fic family protein [Steroidobacteraceae bacterium]
MARPPDKLADSLAALKTLQDRGLVAIPADELTRTHRERLLRGGFIQPVMRGWYIPSRPDEQPGETTEWYASFWGFCAAYLNSRFGDEWCLSPEQSINLHTGNWTVPGQLLVRSPKGGNKPVELLHGTSLFDVRLAMPAAGDMTLKDGLRVYTLPAALIGCAAGQYAAHPVDLRAALAMVDDPSDLLARLLEGGHTVVAGRLAGAFRNIGRDRSAERILKAMRAAGFASNEADPFTSAPDIALGAREISPYVNRMRMMWARMRAPVLGAFPPPPGLPRNTAAYLKEVDDIFVNDAYNSLSIEGYRVSAELIERVRFGNWKPDANEADRQDRNALAARGYWQAFQGVKTSVTKILGGANPGTVADDDYSTWFTQLFEPSVVAGILRPADLAGFRNVPVYIRRSMHVPPNRDAVRETMPAFLDLLKAEPEPAVRIVLGHFAFVYIHPYMDGNGRTGRFLMNAMAASGGYPWIIIPVERRAEYFASLESASVEQDIEPFARFLAGLITRQT